MKDMVSDLRNIRRKIGVSQILLGKLVGVSSVTIYLWERNTAPSKENREKLDEVLANLQQGKMKCPSGFWLGWECMQFEECDPCPYKRDCRRVLRYLTEKVKSI